MSTTPLSALSGPQKAAVLLLSFSADDSAKLISRLSPRQAELLADHLGPAQEVDEHTRRRVVAEFRQAARAALTRPPTAPADLEAPGPTRARPTAAYDRVRDAASPGTTKPPGPRADRPSESGQARPFDYAQLDRISPRALSHTTAAGAPDLSRLADLPVRCRARIADFPLALPDLQSLAAGDVLLLGPAAPSLDLIAGEACRLRCRLVAAGDWRAVELLPSEGAQE